MLFIGELNRGLREELNAMRDQMRYVERLVRERGEHMHYLEQMLKDRAKHSHYIEQLLLKGFNKMGVAP